MVISQMNKHSKSPLVSLLILLISIFFSGLVLTEDSSIDKFLFFLVLIIPFIGIISVLLLLINQIFLSENTSIVHYIIRLGFPILLVMYVLFFPEEQTIQKIPFNQEYSCIIYTKMFDDVYGEGLYYEIRKGRSIVVPMTLYGYVNYEQSEQQYKFSILYAEKGAIVGILDVSAFSLKSHKLIAIYDTRINESWPRLRDDEVSHAPEVEKKWQTIFKQLQKENPNIPVPDYFSQGNQ